MQKVAENIWVQRFPLSLFGTQIGRTTTIVRLRSGELAIHSTAPFTASDINAIGALGRPSWLVEATLLHDTFSEAGHTAFPGIPYLVPEGFPGLGNASSALRYITSLRTPPTAWLGELDVLQLEGMPRVRERVFFHQPTRTLIVADLVFNFGPASTPWTRWFFRYAGGIRQFPGMTRLFRGCIRDRAAFAESIRQMMRWDFDRLIVGHGDIIESGARAKLAAALAAKGF